MKLLTEQERLKIARTVSEIAHINQKDKAGEPYFMHCLRVSNSCKSVSAKIVGFLHDVVEDGHLTHKQLAEMGCFTGHELYCLKLLDKNYNGYLALEHLIERAASDKDGYLKNIKSVAIAREVKIADLNDNRDISRFIRNGIQITEEHSKRLKKYADQLAYLGEQI